MVLVIPTSATTPERVAADLEVSAAYRTGSWTVPVLAPGAYLALATRAALPGGVVLPMERVVIDKGPETVGRLMRAFALARKVEIPPRATVSIDLAPVTLP